MLNLVDKKGQEDRSGELEKKPKKANPDSVAEHASKEDTAKEILEMLEPNPRATGNAKARPEVAERDLRAIHRAVLEYDEVCQNR